MLIEFEILESIVFEYVVGNGLILVNLIDELLEGCLIVVLLLQVEDNGASDE